VQIVAPLSVKVIVPEYLVLPEAPETVAVKVTDWSTTETFPAEEEISVTEVEPGFTVCVSALLLLSLKFVSLL